MFGMGTQELIVVLVIAFLVLGMKNLHNLGKSLGQGIQGFKKGLETGQVREINPNPLTRTGTRSVTSGERVVCGP